MNCQKFQNQFSIYSFSQTLKDQEDLDRLCQYLPLKTNEIFESNAFYGIKNMAQRKPPQSVLNYISYLRKIYPDIKKVYMFGSYAKGSSVKDSDIDIAVVFNDVADSFDLQVQLMKIRRKYDSRIEPHVFRVADFEETYPLVAEIMRTGLELQ